MSKESRVELLQKEHVLFTEMWQWRKKSILGVNDTDEFWDEFIRASGEFDEKYKDYPFVRPFLLNTSDECERIYKEEYGRYSNGSNK